MSFETVARSVVGRTRDHNEDSALAAALDDAWLLAVADGMGGHRAGDVASAEALDRFHDSVQESLRAGMAAEPALQTAVADANDHLGSLVADNPKYEGMGTTLVAALIEPVTGGGPASGSGLRATYVNVGDSRGYHVTDGGIEQVTVDHSLVRQLVEQGQLSPEEAEDHPQRNVISQALGTHDAVDPDCFDRPLAGTALVCSDGLTEELPDAEIHETVVADAPLAERADRLIGLANDRGGSDNISVVLGERTP